MNRKTAIFWWLLFLVALGQQLTKLYFLFQQGEPIDFNVYWQAARITVDGGNVYQKLPTADIPPFNYPPTALIFFSFLLLLPKTVSFWVLLFISLLGLFGTILLLVRLWFTKKISWPAFLILGTLFIQYFPTKFTLTLGQINLVILFLVTFSYILLVRKRDIPAGVLLAAASLIKIFPAVLVLFFIKEKKKKACLAFVATCLLGIILTAIFFKPGLITDYFGRIGQNLFFKAGTVSYFDQSLNSFLLRLKIADLFRLATRIMISLVLVITFLRSKNQAVSYFGLLTVMTLFLPSFVWIHHYVILIPLMILLSAQIYRQKSFLPKIAFLAAYLACSLHFKAPEIISGKNILLESHFFLGAFLLHLLAIDKLKLERNQTGL
ncbi:MAG TPA: glycosyltransferase family 87 protein [Candidatus Bathyarchaeia archaeon]|nr:glycosyltransferase family 87 protein [Candidatus Bathyarchaeia archaeon]